jgi:dTDP-4-dehydrorhamnose reductase
MKIAVIGANGQLGTDLCKVLQNQDVTALDIDEIDITNVDSVKKVFSNYHPDIIINTAAYVRVDDCERHKDTAYKVNAIGARNIAVIAQKVNAKLVFIGTDYIFGGESEPRLIPYMEFDHPAPINIYGSSKLGGEDFVKHLCNRYFIVRVSGLFGVAGSSGKGGNFIETILKLAKERSELRVVDDQIFSPSYTVDVANIIAQLIKTENYGIYHVTNKEICSWYDFALEILSKTGLKTPVIPIKSDELNQQAKRPAYSVMDHYHLRLMGLDNLRSWQEALQDYLKQKKYIT